MPAVWGFLAVTLPLVLTPGASTAVVLRNSVFGGVRAGIQTAAGVNGGSLFYGVLSAFGLAFALRRWPPAWLLLRLGGAGYLFWLALRSFRAAVTPAAAPAAEPEVRAGTSRSPAQNVYEGFLTNTLNPSIASFYLLVVPQFAPEHVFARSVLILTGIHVALALSWHLAWACAGGTLARTLSGGWPRRLLDAGAGVAMAVLAARMLLNG